MNAHFENGKKKALEFLNENYPVSDYRHKFSITIIAKDPDGQLKKLLEAIKSTANPGHSFPVVLDPDDSENKKEFYFDGDGAFYIDKIEVG